MEKEPPHHVRVAATVDLMWAGLTIEEIVRIYSKLNWIDWNPKTTEYQVRDVFKRKLRPYSCKKLRSLGIPKLCCVGD